MQLNSVLRSLALLLSLGLSLGTEVHSTPVWAPLPQDVTPPDSQGGEPSGDEPGEGDPEDEDSDNPDAGVDYSSWTWWWQLNREPYLDLRAQLGLHDPQGAEIPGVLPDAPSTSQVWGKRPDAKVVRGEILPALYKALEAETSRATTTACLIALARLGEDQDGGDRAQVLQHIRPHLQAKDQQVVEAAISALGILGNESACGLLSELLLDTSYGQRLVGGSKVRPRARAFAAYSLGLLGARTKKEDVRRYGVYQLARALEKDQTSTPDLSVACVRAIGMTPLNWSGQIPESGRGKGDPPNASREAQLVYLLNILEKDRLHRQAMAFVPTALAQLLNADATPELGRMRQRVGRALFEKYAATRRTERELRRSCAMALGLVGDSGDPELNRRVFKALARSDRDRITQNWSLMAMGRMGAKLPGLRADARRSLLATLKRKSGGEAEWAALGLALLERDSGAGAHDPATGAALQKRLRKTSRLSEVGAFALALGLCGDPAAQPALGKKLSKVEDPEARGYLALSLAMLGATDKIGLLQDIVDKSENKPRLLRDSSTALALLGDLTIVERLVTMLGTSHSTNAQAGLAQALGRLGDASSVAPLIRMLGNGKATENSRAFAAVALGLVADRDRLPWNTLISLDTNYSAAPPTLMDFDGHGILNLL